MRGRIAVGRDRVLDELLDDAAGILADHGHTITRMDAPEGLTGPADALLIASRTPVTPGFLDAHPELKAVIFLSSGTNSIDLDDAARRGVVVANGATQENYSSMAEATIMLASALLLRLGDRLTECAEQRPRPQPSTLRSRMLMGSTLGLIGYGRIARQIPPRLAGWGVTVLAHSRGATPADAPGVELVGLDELLRRSDVVSLHLALTAQTRGIIGERELGLMRPESYLINTARGGLVDEDALARALREGTLAGAAIDTVEHEPVAADNPLRGCPGLLLTDHIIGHTRQMYDSLVPAAVANLEAVMESETPPGVVRSGRITPPGDTDAQATE